jgi:hypothetical protein
MVSSGNPPHMSFFFSDQCLSSKTAFSILMTVRDAPRLSSEFLIKLTVRVDKFLQPLHPCDSVRVSHVHTILAFETVGVHNVETNVESKTVLVDADPSITPQFIFEKLEKVSVRPSVSFRDTTRIVYACNVLSVYSCIVFFKIGVGKIEREVGRNGRVRLFVSARFVYHG